MPRLSALHSSGARHGVSGCQLRANASRHVTSRLPTCPRALPSDPVATNHTGGATGTSTSPEHLLQEVLDQLKTLNKGTKKLTQQVQRLEDRIGELYEFTSLPIIANHFGNDFSDSADLTSATSLVDHLLTLALNLELPALKQRSVLISTLEDYVLKDRQGLRAAMGALINEACDERGVCMVAIPSNFRTCGWDDVRACLQELQLGYGSNGSSSGGDERIINLLRLVDALELGSPPRPLPGFVEMASSLAMGRCLSAVSLDCRGRIDVRETYIEFHIGAFKGANSGIPETCALLRNAAVLLSWTYRVLEPSLHTFAAGRSPRDVQTIGYTFTVGKVTPAESAQLKLFDEFSIEAHGSRSTADVAYRYFSVRPTGISEHYAKS